MKFFKLLIFSLFCGISLLTTTLAFGESLLVNDPKPKAIEPTTALITTSSNQNEAHTTSRYLLTEMTASEFSKLAQAEQQTIAARFGLSASDYAEYLQLMEGSPDGLYYRDQHLDPSWILGMNAKTEAERKKYVTLAILHERERMAKLLLFQQTFDRLQHELFPDNKPIQFSPNKTTIGVPLTCRKNY